MPKDTHLEKIDQHLDIKPGERIARVSAPFDDYYITSLGRVISVKRPNKPLVLKQQENSSGYYKVELHDNSDGICQKTFRVHRLVASGFLKEQPDGHEVRHLDGNPKNNKASNLEWGTRADNVSDAIRHGTHSGPKCFDGETALEIRQAYARGEFSQREASKMYGVSRGTIAKLLRGDTYKYAGGPTTRESKERAS
jgi:hypothetical protein